MQDLKVSPQHFTKKPKESLEIATISKHPQQASDVVIRQCIQWHARFKEKATETN
jgi:hypothetical protein